MSIKNCSCVIVLCDRCEDYWWNNGDEWAGAAHYESLEDALEELANKLDWRIADDKHLCPDCSKIEDCERNGHMFMSWQTCWCRLNADEGEPTCGHLWRQCAHCDGAYEQISFDSIPTV